MHISALYGNTLDTPGYHFRTGVAAKAWGRKLVLQDRSTPFRASLGAKATLTRSAIEAPVPLKTSLGEKGHSHKIGSQSRDLRGGRCPHLVARVANHRGMLRVGNVEYKYSCVLPWCTIRKTTTSFLQARSDFPSSSTTVIKRPTVQPLLERHLKQSSGERMDVL